MAECIVCGKAMKFFQGDEHRRCNECRDSQRWPVGHPRRQSSVENSKIDQDKEQAVINAIMLTTETTPNLNITKRIEIVTAECAFGMNIFKDLFAGIRDIVGGRSEAVQKTLRDSRKTALYELKKEAHAVGANAVVGVDLDYVELSAAGNMVLLVASGTAVVIEERQQ
jgi:uncharacterized protein YbjQ (UPF0145 family)